MFVPNMIVTILMHWAGQIELYGHVIEAKMPRPSENNLTEPMRYLYVFFGVIEWI